MTSKHPPFNIAVTASGQLTQASTLLVTFVMLLMLPIIGVYESVVNLGTDKVKIWNF